ncbi:MAG: c-type cytochrome [Acidobacteriota bacterium]|nr:c-type cytochrome [Acidobacteriota bacterium]
MIRRIVMSAGSILFCASLFAGTSFAQDSATKGDAAKGKQTFEQCSMCHNVDSPEKKMGPSLQGLFKKKTLQSGKPVNDANVLAQINNGGNGMPGYADMLSAQDKADVLAYLHTL